VPHVLPHCVGIPPTSGHLGVESPCNPVLHRPAYRKRTLQGCLV
jgi:hypothetical protein